MLFHICQTGDWTRGIKTASIFLALIDPEYMLGKIITVMYLLPVYRTNPMEFIGLGMPIKRLENMNLGLALHAQSIEMSRR